MKLGQAGPACPDGRDCIGAIGSCVTGTCARTAGDDPHKEFDLWVRERKLGNILSRRERSHLFAAFMTGWERRGAVRAPGPEQQAKYVVTRSDGGHVPLDEPLWVLRARDRYALAAIRYYQTLCVNAGLPARFIAAIGQHMDRMTAWQEVHGTKTPD